MSSSPTQRGLGHRPPPHEPTTGRPPTPTHSLPYEGAGCARVLGQAGDGDAGDGDAGTVRGGGDRLQARTEPEGQRGTLGCGRQVADLDPVTEQDEGEAGVALTGDPQQPVDLRGVVVQGPGPRGRLRVAAAAGTETGSAGGGGG